MKKIFLFLLFFTIGFNPLPNASGEEGDSNLTIPVPDYSSIVVIRSKTHQSILTSKGLFFITAITKVYDAEGKEVEGGIAGLPVPCRAQIYHEKVKAGDPTAVKIVIIQVFPNATTVFSPTPPE